MAMGVTAPAFAGGGHYGHGYYKRHHGHHYNYRRHHHRGGGGKAAAIALGVVGGAIILNELAEANARDRYYEDRYYRDRYYDSQARARAYDRGYAAGRYDGSRYESYEDDAYYGEEPYADEPYEDEAYDDSGLAGGEPAARGPVYRTPGSGAYDRAPRAISASAAYRTCLDHARRALGERGFVVTAPYRPETVEDRGGALMMTATVTAQRGRDQWARAMSCEASESRVYRMELI
ncbi:hypothetical protein CW354_09315 [Marinicaulis flavus]|uniref:Uncharacterized protein n=2 Tax=Hyphococcus luteus TaxID=2058213 RepID=A0A2S7K7I7_9PROT|nr:hypothetical protein CW354_09315 [Marinicaulis flavus]